MFPPSVVKQLVHRAGLVVHGKLVDDGFGRLVHPDDSDLCAFPAELEHGHVESRNRGNVPDMGAAHVDGDFLEGLLEVEGGHEILCRGEKELSLDDVGSLAPVCGYLRPDPEELRDLACEEDA